MSSFTFCLGVSKKGYLLLFLLCKAKKKSASLIQDSFTSGVYNVVYFREPVNLKGDYILWSISSLTVIREDAYGFRISVSDWSTLVNNLHILDFPLKFIGSSKEGSKY